MTKDRNNTELKNNLITNDSNDLDANFIVSDNFEQFNQINDIFSRAFWDKSIKSKETDEFFDSYRNQPSPKNSYGFQQKDFALRNSSWAISDMISERGSSEGKREGFQSEMLNSTPVAKQKVECKSLMSQTKELKTIAKLFGADLIGITKIDERWHYSHSVNTLTFKAQENKLSKLFSNVIVLGHSMNKELVDTYPSALAGASTGIEYSREAAIVTQLTSYIRGLGYEATGSMNDTALAIPYAIKAGLGEYARNQMVITPEYGPRVRFSKIFTNLPLTIDKPKVFGVKDYCNICTKCAESCPPKALPFGNPEYSSSSKSSIKGVKKWTANCEKCFAYWAKIKTDCAICMRVCPFNRNFKTIEGKLFWKIATSSLRFLAYWWDKKIKPSKRLKPDLWWNKN